MWQRFSERARMAVFAAQAELQRTHGLYVETEHLLLGVLAQDDSTAVAALTALGISVDDLRDDLRRRLRRGEPDPDREITMTPRCKRAIDLAYGAARTMEDRYIGTEHLLLGLVEEGDGLAGRTLARFGVALDPLREAILPLRSPEGKPSSYGIDLLERVAARFGFWYGRTPDPPFGMPGILRRLTPSARALVDAAQARALATGGIGVEAGHLILALLDRPECRGMRVVASLGADLAAIRLGAERGVLAGPGEDESGSMAFAPSGQTALEGADVAARAMGNPFVGTEHLALVLFGGLAGEFVGPETLSPIRLREAIEASQSEDAG